MCCGWSGERESVEPRGSLAARTSMGAGGEWSRRKKPRKGTLGLFSVPPSVGDCEYIEEPLTMERTLWWSPPKRDELCETGDPSGVWSGRGDHLNSVGIGIVVVLVATLCGPRSVRRLCMTRS